MRILIISQYFPPEPVKVGDLASGLRDLGHEVTVLTGFPNYPHGRLYPGVRMRPWRRETWHGIRVVRVSLFPDHSYSSLRRMLNYASFAASASVLGPALVGGFDRILVFQTSPITMAVPAVVLRWLRRRRLILWVQDIWPDTLEATGITLPGWLRGAVGWLSREVYRRCDVVLVQSRGFISRITAQDVQSERIIYLPNWAEEVYQVADPDAAFARAEGLDHGFRVLFAGNIGVAQNLDVLLDAAERLRGIPEIQIVVVGDGAMYDPLVSRARSLGLPNVVFKGRRPAAEMPKFFAAAEGLLVHLRRDPLFAVTIPGKVQAYLACGRPIIAAVEGNAAEVVAESGGGIVCAPGDPEALAGAILRLWQMPQEERREMGENCRRYYERQFDRRLILSRLDQLLTV